MKLPIILLVLILFFSACQHNDAADENGLFSVLNERQTGILFNNRLEENTFLNGFVYEYYYNGAGVATADFNKDGLMDIYFVSNRRANHLYLNQGELKFKNIAKEANAIGGFGFPTGVTVVDINADGWMDIYISKSGVMKDPKHLENELLINKGLNEDGIPVFEEQAAAYNLNLAYNSTQAAFFDYDRDGDLDMFLGNHGKDVYSDDELVLLMLSKPDRSGERLYKNENGKYIEVTKEAGIISNKIAFTLGIGIGDINNDGWPDIFTSHDYSEKDHLYLNNRDGTFTETSLDAFGHISNFSMGNDIADINNDGLLDIMTVDMTAQDNYTNKTSMSGMSVERFYRHTDLGLHHQYMYNALHLNNGLKKGENTPYFSNIEQIANVASTDWSWGPLFFDMNNDGRKDLFVSNGVKRDFRNNDFKLWHKEYHNNIATKAEKEGRLDKDKYMTEVISRLPFRKKKNYFFLNNDDLRFKQIDVIQPETNSNGAAYADFDNDGDIDIVVNNSEDRAFIYRNNADGNQNFIKIKLEGTLKNVNAIGARVEIITSGQSQMAEQYFSRGFQSASADAIHFGLGASTNIDTLTVFWPGGTIQRQFNILANQEILISYNGTKTQEPLAENNKKLLFNDITEQVKINFRHQENEYNDFEEESLIPHKMSMMGPGLAVADANNDGLDDFYIGGAKDQAGALFFQEKTGEFMKASISVFEKDKSNEDTGALFFDADGDGDQDLYVVSGGNEKAPNDSYYTDRFYENKGRGNFVKNTDAIPLITTSGKSIVAGDYDNDGDLDLFVGSRVVPRKYGYLSKSYILENQSQNGKIKFEDVTAIVAPELEKYTMTTDAIWTDFDGDQQMDLIIANEWGIVDFFKNTNNKLEQAPLGIEEEKGWWYSLALDDIDQDGKKDLIAGNLGLNYKYKASPDAPFHMYLNDFDQNESEDIVLAYHEADKVFPVRGRECSSNQMPFIKEKFKTYDAFAKAEVMDVFGDKLEESVHYAMTNFSNGIFKNIGDNKLKFTPFENAAQLSSINKILVDDFDNDGRKDLILLGNLFSSEVETPRNDASYGHFLKGNGKGGFKTITAIQSGLFVKGDVKDAALITVGNKKSFLIARNNGPLALVSYSDGDD